MAGTLVLALPFLVAAYQLAGSHFISNHHAHLIEKALIVLDRGRLELIGFVYPPLPFLLLLLWPVPLVAMTLAALAGGGMAWVLWQRLMVLPFPRIVQALLLIAPLSVPSMLYLGTQAFGEMLVLLLVLIAWVSFLNFTRAGETRAGFLAGLSLGAGFFANFYAAVYAVPFALLAPLFMKDRRRGAAIAAAFVLLFPVVTAVLSWSYLSWLFTGDFLNFARDPGSSVFVYTKGASEDLPLGWPLALRATAHDVLSSPLYLISGLIVARLWPSRLLGFLVPLGLITGFRAAGLVYADYFAVGTLTVVALAALPPHTPSRWWPVLLLAAGVHVWIGYATPLKGEPAAWARAMTSTQTGESDRQEQVIASHLAQKQARSVLVDDRIAYRIVSRAGTARPFVLPADALYGIAESQPAEFVQYVLVPALPSSGSGSRLATVYPVDPPQGVRLVTSWRDWRLYGRVEAARSGSIAGAGRRP